MLNQDNMVGHNWSLSYCRGRTERIYFSQDRRFHTKGLVRAQHVVLANTTVSVSDVGRMTVLSDAMLTRIRPIPSCKIGQSASWLF